MKCVFQDVTLKCFYFSSTMLAEYLDRTGASSIPISEVEADEICERIGFVGSNDYMWFDASGYPGGAQAANKLVNLLKKFGGSPKTVHPMPNWLAAKLERWRLQRHQVSEIDTFHHHHLSCYDLSKQHICRKQFDIIFLHSFKSTFIGCVFLMRYRVQQAIGIPH